MNSEKAPSTTFGPLLTEAQHWNRGQPVHCKTIGPGKPKAHPWPGVLRPHQSLANPIGSRCECWLKNRTISAEASGPLGSVYEPEELPPDHA